MLEFGHSVRIPDFWQAEALTHLREGKDVVLHAPTGAGKTFVFEMFFTENFKGRAVYTVPTRALANDKYSQWKSQGWRVGISTGDYCVDVDSPLVVATLETQKTSFFTGDTPELLVIDEYQLIGDSLRGANYELAIAASSASTQLLLMSGSVENTKDVVNWLRKIGRDAELVSHSIRAVPLEDIISTSLPDLRARNVRGMWARLVQKIIEADMSPLLIFAPRRNEAESIARSLASELPCVDFLNLKRELSDGAGKELASMLRKRVAYHHSGLSAFQRSAIVEKLARESELKVVVATTGLGAGVNFSMRSVIITDREYETAACPCSLRNDELLQMYGRAGRRGLDKIGYAISIPSKPRLSEAKTAILKRSEIIDAPSIIRIMSIACDNNESPINAAKNFCRKLFSDSPIDLGFDAFKAYSKKKSLIKDDVVERVEILNSKNLWERKRPSAISNLSDVLFFERDNWIAFTKSSKAIESLKRGSVTKLSDGNYGLLLNLGVLDYESEQWKLTKQFSKIIRECKERGNFRNLFTSKICSLKNIKRNANKIIENSYAGAKCVEFVEVGDILKVKLDVSSAKISAVCDSYMARLFNPPTRSSLIENQSNFAKLAGFSSKSKDVGQAQTWFDLGLIDKECRPTMRGRIFSFFNAAEGLAIAAALEDESYDILDIIYDIANLRAGHRFGISCENASSRLADVCRLKYSMMTIKGYLTAGVPITYGDGASEKMREIKKGSTFTKLEDALLKRGDIERAYLEWQSMLRHISNCSDLKYNRWLELKIACRNFLIE